MDVVTYSKHMMHEYLFLSYSYIVALYLHDYCTTLPYTTLTISTLPYSMVLYLVYTISIPMMYLAIEYMLGYLLKFYSLYFIDI